MPAKSQPESHCFCRSPEDDDQSRICVELEWITHKGASCQEEIDDVSAAFLAQQGVVCYSVLAARKLVGECAFQLIRLGDY